jgi:hypothetical protein
VALRRTKLVEEGVDLIAWKLEDFLTRQDRLGDFIEHVAVLAL